MKNVLLYQNIVYFYIRNQNNQKLKNQKMKKSSFKLKKHWSNRLGKLQRINLQNENLGIGKNHSDIRFRLTQLAIKFKL